MKPYAATRTQLEQKIIQKSKTMALGSWANSHTIMGITYHTELRILCIKMTTKIQQSAINIWRKVIGKIRAQTRDAYSRTLSLAQRVPYVHNYLLAKAWYTAQIRLPTRDCKLQLNTAMSWYLWQDDIFRAPLSTLYRRKEHGECKDDNSPEVKEIEPSTTEQESSQQGKIPSSLDYLLILETDSAYMVSQGKTVTVQTYRRLIRHYTDPYEYRDKTPQHAHRTALAEYRMAKNMEESVDSPSHRPNEDNMVQDYTRYCPYKGTPPQNPYSSH